MEEGKDEVEVEAKKEEEHMRGKERKRDGEGKWCRELYSSQLATAGVLGEKGEIVHPH